MERLPRALGVLIAVFLAAPAAPGGVYHPLVPGTQWHYANDYGELEDMSILEEREILGVVTVVRHEEIHDARIPAQVFENFWTTNPEGDLFLHGAVNYTDTIEVAYWPPILVVDGPLFVGKSWTTEDICLYYLDGSPMDSDPFGYPMAVYSVGDIDVPAGVFHSFGVGSYLTPSVRVPRLGHTYDVFGRRLCVDRGPVGRDATHWYSEGVGVVQYSYFTDPGEMLKLTSWQPTPVSRQSWGRIKALFRCPRAD